MVRKMPVEELNQLLMWAQAMGIYRKCWRSSLLAEGGSNLSGGQKRLSIARGG